MKKILGLIVTVVFTIGMSSAAFADNGNNDGNHEHHGHHGHHGNHDNDGCDNDNGNDHEHNGNHDTRNNDNDDDCGGNNNGGSKNLECNGTFSNVTFKKVTVPSGASCYLYNVHASSVQAKPGSVDTYVIDSTIEHNVMANGATGTVKVGSNDCKYDPEVGNNLMVKDSHNVLICYVHAGNNIVVTGNDGAITVRESAADNNLHVSRNDAYTGGAGTHRHPDWIRVRGNTIGGHIQVRGNDRHVKVWKNTTGTGYQCSGDVTGC